MESSIESTIEKIKLQEHDNEAKLKEKRTYEAMAISLNRGIREAVTLAAKLKQEHLEAVTRTDELRSRLQIEKARQKALTDLLLDTRVELQKLQEQSTQGVLNVWNSRSLLCKSIQSVSNQCDVWALFTKPNCIQLPTTKKAIHDNKVHTRGCDDRLKNAIKRHTQVLADRHRLQNEPDTGEEFLR